MVFGEVAYNRRLWGATKYWETLVRAKMGLYRETVELNRKPMAMHREPVKAHRRKVECQ